MKRYSLVFAACVVLAGFLGVQAWASDEKHEHESPKWYEFWESREEKHDDDHHHEDKHDDEHHDEQTESHEEHHDDHHHGEDHSRHDNEKHEIHHNEQEITEKNLG